MNHSQLSRAGGGKHLSQRAAHSPIVLVFHIFLIITFLLPDLSARVAC
jgi:hypothetical protein